MGFETFQDTLVWKTSNSDFDDWQQNATNCNERSHWRRLSLSQGTADGVAVIVFVLEFCAANGSMRELDKPASQANFNVI